MEGSNENMDMDENDTLGIESLQSSSFMFENMFAYVEICYLFLFVAIGVPINLFTLMRVGRQYYVTKSRILLLNVNLNISDLMILIFYAFAQALWFATERWLGGWMLCKLTRFFQLFSFCLSSNVIVCIGLDRLWSLLEPLHVKSVANLRCKRMVIMAWIIAAITSAPQLYFWNLCLLPVHENYYQCVNTFGFVSNSSGLQLEDFSAKAGVWAVVYDIYILLITFWLPCIIVIICYVIILKRVLKHLGDDPQVEIVQTTKTCDCSSGASAAGIMVGSPYMDYGLPSSRVRNQRQQFRRELQSDRRSSGSQSHHQQLKKRQSCESCNGHQKLVLQQSLQRRQAGQMRIRRTKYRTLKVTMFIVAAYIVCWLPYNFYNIWILVYPDSDTFWNALSGLIALNAIVNPLIYGRLTLALYWKGRKHSEKALRRFDAGRAGRFI